MALGWRKETGKRRWRGVSARLLIVSSIVSVIGFSTLCINVLFDMRRGEEALARQTLENLAATIEADISRNIEIYDLSLRAVATNMLVPEIRTVSKPLRQLILFDHATTARHFGAIQVLDAMGHVVIDQASLDPVPEDRGQEEYFRVQRDDPGAGLFISRPTLHRGAYSIVLSRRISDAKGGFLGVVVGSIRFSYFHELFDHLKLDPEDTITVLKRDRTIIMRRPFDLDVIGTNVGDRSSWDPSKLVAGGSYAGAGPVDSTPRLFVRRDSGGAIFVIAGKPLESVYSLWEHEALRIAGLVAALVLFVLASTFVLAREISRRAEAESKLEEMATTDALTGLRNRRKFDILIEAEWRRAMRHDTPLSLLMIDADHFKQFNDTYGHLAGDELLIGIGICISDSVRRAEDCAARYGGEEFAVLLPGLDEAEALAIAETIRQKVQGWSEDASGTTVSIGIACLRPAAWIDWAVLVAAADRALYAAKAGGRNRAVLASIPQLPRAA